MPLGMYLLWCDIYLLFCGFSQSYSWRTIQQWRGNATLISSIVEAVIVMIYVFFLDKVIALSLKELFRFDRIMGASLLKYGLPAVLGDIVWAINAFAYTAIIDRFTAEHITAFNIAGMMNTLVYVWMSGIAIAVGIMTGKKVGSGETDGIRLHVNQVQKCIVAVVVVNRLNWVKNLTVSHNDNVH
jgi:Na+-driven multidrug efflux pump